jgi:hypothetical protein
MVPIKFTVKDGITYFHYKYSDLKEFVKCGKLNGDVGHLLIKREGDLLTYKGFGTIENPMYSMITISILYLPLFDGEMMSDEERLVPPKPLFTDYKMIFLDLN